jgi:WLM domain
VPFAYYDRLSRRDKELYDRSDRIRRIELPRAEGLRPIVEVLRQGLAGDDRKVVEAAATRLVLGITAILGTETVEVGVLAVRPSLRAAELHGLYTRDEERRARIRVWMRTVHYKRVVAFRTFLRTLLHELCHHLDYCHFKLADSFHTEGFFQRESSLFYQLVPRDQGPEPTSSAETTGQ